MTSASAEKHTQTAATTAASDQINGTTIWQVNLPPAEPNAGGGDGGAAVVDCSDLALNEALTCQELLAFSVAFSAALPTNQSTLETFYTSLAKTDGGGGGQPGQSNETAEVVKNGAARAAAAGAASVVQQQPPATIPTAPVEDFSCCLDLYLQVNSWSAITSFLNATQLGSTYE